MPVRGILAATDFSPAAEQAVTRAAQIAKASGAHRLDAVHVVSRMSLKSMHRLLSSTAERLQPRLIEEAQVTLRHVAEDVARQHGLSVESHVGIGRISAEIVAYSDQVDASLIVVGARGTSSMRDLVIGTTAENVLRRTRRPLLIVRKALANPYRKVLVATDFSPSALSALQLAGEIAKGARFTVLHAYEVPFEGKLRYAGVAERTIQEYRDQARSDAERASGEFLRASRITASEVLRHGYPAAVIRDFAAELQPDLIAVGKHGQSGVEELLLGSVSAHVLANAGCDVLVACDPDRQVAY